MGRYSRGTSSGYGYEQKGGHGDGEGLESRLDCCGDAQGWGTGGGAWTCDGDGAVTCDGDGGDVPSKLTLKLELKIVKKAAKQNLLPLIQVSSLECNEAKSKLEELLKGV